MIARVNRFHGRNAVGRVRGSTYQCDLFSVRFQHKSDASFRMAAVVSKKIDNRAVVRNRIRRRLFESFGGSLWLKNSSVDIVVYAKTAELASLPVLDIEDATQRALKFIESRTMV